MSGAKPTRNLDDNRHGAPTACPRLRLAPLPCPSPVAASTVFPCGATVKRVRQESALGANGIGHTMRALGTGSKNRRAQTQEEQHADAESGIPARESERCGETGSAGASPFGKWGIAATSRPAPARDLRLGRTTPPSRPKAHRRAPGTTRRPKEKRCRNAAGPLEPPIGRALWVTSERPAVAEREG